MVKTVLTLQSKVIGKKLIKDHGTLFEQKKAIFVEFRLV